MPDQEESPKREERLAAIDQEAQKTNQELARLAEALKANPKADGQLKGPVEGNDNPIFDGQSGTEFAAAAQAELADLKTEGITDEEIEKKLERVKLLGLQAQEAIGFITGLETAPATGDRATKEQKNALKQNTQALKKRITRCRTSLVGLTELQDEQAQIALSAELQKVGNDWNEVTTPGGVITEKDALDLIDQFVGSIDPNGKDLTKKAAAELLSKVDIALLRVNIITTSLGKRKETATEKKPENRERKSALVVNLDRVSDLLRRASDAGLRLKNIFRKGTQESLEQAVKQPEEGQEEDEIGPPAFPQEARELAQEERQAEAARQALIELNQALTQARALDQAIQEGRLDEFQQEQVDQRTQEQAEKESEQTAQAQEARRELYKTNLIAQETAHQINIRLSEIKQERREGIVSAGRGFWRKLGREVVASYQDIKQAKTDREQAQTEGSQKAENAEAIEKFTTELAQGWQEVSGDKARQELDDLLKIVTSKYKLGKDESNQTKLGKAFAKFAKSPILHSALIGIGVRLGLKSVAHLTGLTAAAGAGALIGGIRGAINEANRIKRTELGFSSWEKEIDALDTDEQKLALMRNIAAGDNFHVYFGGRSYEAIQFVNKYAELRAQEAQQSAPVIDEMFGKMSEIYKDKHIARRALFAGLKGAAQAAIISSLAYEGTNYLMGHGQEALNRLIHHEPGQAVGAGGNFNNGPENTQPNAAPAQTAPETGQHSNPISKWLESFRHHNQGPEAPNANAQIETPQTPQATQPAPAAPGTIGGPQAGQIPPIEASPGAAAGIPSTETATHHVVEWRSGARLSFDTNTNQFLPGTGHDAIVRIDNTSASGATPEDIGRVVAKNIARSYHGDSMGMTPDQQNTIAGSIAKQFEEGARWHHGDAPVHVSVSQINEALREAGLSNQDGTEAIKAAAQPAVPVGPTGSEQAGTTLQTPGKTLSPRLAAGGAETNPLEAPRVNPTAPDAQQTTGSGAIKLAAGDSSTTAEPRVDSASSSAQPTAGTGAVRLEAGGPDTATSANPATPATPTTAAAETQTNATPAATSETPKAPTTSQRTTGHGWHLPRWLHRDTQPVQPATTQEVAPAQKLEAAPIEAPQAPRPGESDLGFFARAKQEFANLYKSAAEQLREDGEKGRLTNDRLTTEFTNKGASLLKSIKENSVEIGTVTTGVVVLGIVAKLFSGDRKASLEAQKYVEKVNQAIEEAVDAADKGIGDTLAELAINNPKLVPTVVARVAEPGLAAESLGEVVTRLRDELNQVLTETGLPNQSPNEGYKKLIDRQKAQAKKMPRKDPNDPMLAKLNQNIQNLERANEALGRAEAVRNLQFELEQEAKRRNAEAIASGDIAEASRVFENPTDLDEMSRDTYEFALAKKINEISDEELPSTLQTILTLPRQTQRQVLDVFSRGVALEVNGQKQPIHPGLSGDFLVDGSIVTAEELTGIIENGIGKLVKDVVKVNDKPSKIFGSDERTIAQLNDSLRETGIRWDFVPNSQIRKFEGDLRFMSEDLLLDTIEGMYDEAGNDPRWWGVIGNVLNRAAQKRNFYMDNKQIWLREDFSNRTDDNGSKEWTLSNEDNARTLTSAGVVGLILNKALRCTTDYQKINTDLGEVLDNPDLVEVIGKLPFGVADRENGLKFEARIEAIKDSPGALNEAVNKATEGDKLGVLYHILKSTKDAPLEVNGVIYRDYSSSQGVLTLKASENEEDDRVDQFIPYETFKEGFATGTIKFV